MRLQLRRCKILKHVHVGLLNLFSRIIQLPEALFEDSTYHPVMILHVVLDHGKSLSKSRRSSRYMSRRGVLQDRQMKNIILNSTYVRCVKRITKQPTDP